MRTNYRFKTALLLLMAVGGASSAWADEVNIPQDLGSYINWSNATINGCSTENTGNTDGGNLGSTSGATPTASFTLVNSAEKDLLITFKSSIKDGTAEWNITLTNSTSEEILNKDFHVDNTTDFSKYNNTHDFAVNNLPTGTYTLTFTAKSHTTGSYAGNLKYLGIYEVPAFTSNTAFNLNTGTNKFVTYTNNSMQYESSNDNVGYIKNTSYATYYFANAVAGDYLLSMGIKGYDSGTMNVKITNLATGADEYTSEYNIPSSSGYETRIIGLPNMTKGIKKMVLSFSASHDNYICNYKSLTFKAATDFDALPIYGTAVLDMSKGSITSSSNPRYSSSSGTNNEISYIYKEGYADDFVFISGEETSYYDLRTTISNYNQGGTIKVTITDVKTGTVIVDAQESAEITSNGQNIVMPLTTALTPGLKKIRFDFVNASASDWLYNIKDVSFYKRSLNESYDYTPVAASGVDVVLTRSIKANKWSTIVLPFDVASENIETIFGAGTTVAELTSGDATTLTFTTTLTDNKMKANQPYAIKVATGFTSATISNVDIVAATPTQTVGTWNFTGSYTNGSIPDGSYYFSANKLWQASGKGIRMKPFRAYFTNGTAAPTLNFIIDSETTGIGEKLNMNSNNAVSTTYYNLNGQRVSQPAKGLYIVNGKKVIIK